MKKLTALLLACILVFATFALVGCKENQQQLSPTEEIIAQAQTMSLEELARKAIEESNGKTFNGVGNSSRGKTALPYFIDYLKTIDPDYALKEFTWNQPKNNTIFEMLEADASTTAGTYSMTLIQDGNQIESKMVQTGILDRFIPKGWAEANETTAEEYDGYLALQTLNKVFMYNCVNTEKTYTNIWDFVRENEHGLFMDIDSEIVGKNFLYMLTKPQYAAELKKSYDLLEGAQKTYVDNVVNEVAATADELGLDANGKYALAWIKLWVGSYSAQTDDGPICNSLVKSSAVDQFGLIVYSKLRSVEESTDVSKNNIKIAAYQDNYKGLAGYGYCHYLFVTDNSPLPWTACAFIAYMTETQKGFDAWGKDIGGYSSNPDVAEENERVHQHKTGGMAEDGTTVLFDCLNDRGFEFWEPRLVIEDPEYCASVAFTVGNWIEGLEKYKG